MTARSDDRADPDLELLGLLGEELASGEIDYRLVASDETAPAQLVVPIDRPHGPATTVHVCFLPGHHLPPVLQYLVPLEHEVAADAIETTARFLHLLNTNLPLPGFELGETASAVVFRHVQAVSVQPLVPEVVAWPLSLIYHAVSGFDHLIALASTGTPYADLVAGLGHAMTDLLATAEAAD